MKNCNLKFKIDFYFFIVVFIFSFLLFSLSVANASVFYFSPPHAEINVGDETKVFLMLDTEDERVNAIEGKVVFSKDKLDVVEIIYDDSVINLWIEEPVLREDGKIIFAGITPGGFDGVRKPFQKEVESGKILTFIFKAKNVGSGAVILENTRALLNDGEGTETDISLIPFSVDILEKAESNNVSGFIYGIIIILGTFFIYILWRRKKS